MPTGDAKSDYAEKKVLDLILGAVAFPAPATVYVSLHTADPTDLGTGTEVTGGSYARVALTNNLTNWPAATGTAAVKSNGTAINFPTSTAAWGTVVSFGIWDAVTTGNLLYYAALTASQVIGSGQTPSFAVGQLTIGEA